jgi:hypothetical protein
MVSSRVGAQVGNKVLCELKIHEFCEINIFDEFQIKRALEKTMGNMGFKNW